VSYLDPLKYNITYSDPVISSDPVIAKEMLKMRVVLNKRDPVNLDKWEAAISATQ